MGEAATSAAARPLAKTFLDLKLPSNDVYAEVQRLVLNLIAMNEILRDREQSSIRLVMNPEKMVVREAQRTFTYLNLYGYLTDAVIVNRVSFPPMSPTATSPPGGTSSRSRSSSSSRPSRLSRC